MERPRLHLTRAGRSLALFVAFWALSPVAPAQDPYSNAIEQAKASRTVSNDAVFSQLRVITSDLLVPLVTPTGTFPMIRVSTMTRDFGYSTATNRQPFHVATNRFSWVTLDGDLRNWYHDKGLPISNNATIRNSMLEALGMQHNTNYNVLTFLVSPSALTRPAFNPSISTNTAPIWNASKPWDFGTGTGQYDFVANVTDAVSSNFWAWAGGVSYPGPENFTNWHLGWSTESYASANPNNLFPFTGLGFTWNWNTNASLEGFALSEFVVNSDTDFYFDSYLTPYDYVVIPEPGALALLLAGGLLFLGWRRVPPS
ncbi:MAG: PEP-CTERM sorting domain-containing protein [Verrucomicrobiia bacterium]|jgi:hypothetical protein